MRSLADLNMLQRMVSKQRTWSQVLATSAWSRCASLTRRTISMPPSSRVLFCTSWSTNQLTEAKALHATCALPRRAPLRSRAASLAAPPALRLCASRKANRRTMRTQYGMSWFAADPHLHQVCIEGVGVHGLQHPVDAPEPINGQAAHTVDAAAPSAAVSRPALAAPPAGAKCLSRAMAEARGRAGERQVEAPRSIARSVAKHGAPVVLDVALVEVAGHGVEHASDSCAPSLSLSLPLRIDGTRPMQQAPLSSASRPGSERSSNARGRLRQARYRRRRQWLRCCRCGRPGCTGSGSLAPARLRCSRALS